MNRVKSYLERPELRTHPLGTVLRRGYYEVVQRTAPKRLQRLHRSRLRWTNYAFFAPLTEPVGKSLFLYGIYEPLATAAYASLLDEADVAVDVGAHYGDFSLVAAARVGAGGCVYASEPQDSVRAVLLKNIRDNDIGHVTVLDCALGAHPGLARLYGASDPRQTGGASLSKSQAGLSEMYTEVQVRRLDDVVPEEHRHRVTAVKIDVEGSEAAVLRGAGTLLTQAQPAVIFEVNGLSTAHDGFGCEAFSVLYEYGYRLYGMRPEGPSFRLEPIQRGEDPLPYREPWLALNLLALAPGSACENRLRLRGHFC